MKHSNSTDYKKIDRIHLLRLKGNSVERARQHGKWIQHLTQGDFQSLALHTLAHKNQSLIARSVGSKILDHVYENFVTRILLCKLTQDQKQTIEAMMDAANLKKHTREAWLALYQADMIMMLAALSTEHHRPDFLEGMPGCSTAILKKNSSHEFYFARNLDYPTASTWERWPTVCYHEPDHSQRYYHIGSLGIHTAGVTGGNESGIAFSIHAHFSKKFQLRGTPIFFLGEQILENARTLDDALSIIKKFKTIGSWAFNVASFAENKAVSVEIAEGKMFVRDSEILTHTNAFQSKGLLKNELHFSGATDEDVYCRKESMVRQIQKRLPHYSLEDSFMTLAQSHDVKTGEKHVFGNVSSVVTSIQSVVFEPHTQSIYISAREESPTPLGPYIKLPFLWENLNESHFSQAPIEVNHGHSPEFIEAIHHYHLAYVSWQVKHEAPSATLAHLQEAVRCAPHDSHLLMQKGYFELLTHDYLAAKASLSEALKHTLSPHLNGVATYFLGACHDLNHNRSLAVTCYQKSVLSQNDLLRKKSEKRLKRPFKASDCQKIKLDLQFAEPFQYT